MVYISGTACILFLKIAFWYTYLIHATAFTIQSSGKSFIRPKGLFSQFRKAGRTQGFKIGKNNLFRYITLFFRD